jgi:light-regulated signal transduction histidine kinase (bacteriophytochrome)
MGASSGPKVYANFNRPEAALGTIIHEVGDLLQTVNASVSSLQNYFPPQSGTEQSLLTNLRARAADSKRLVEIIYDLATPLNLTPRTINLMELGANAAQKASRSFPDVKIHTEFRPVPSVLADPNRMAQVGNLVFAFMGGRGSKNVLSQIEPSGNGGAAWIITDDGPKISCDFEDFFAAPFNTKIYAPSLLAIALARKIVLIHGGNMTVGNLGQNGFRTTMELPGTE